ncbi:hypothetical protein M0L20_09520 [Spirosoma sp. RP8]|uniref:Carboxypeptidase regulatory-like domain-containing protein n=1 Tax=Spirosoma liriopis TaxID=2937440 RepID=A0ABT0HJB5_9BACT|nr:hypothetical protein [Spirosoma liriopis]MCK8492085.1 hypothetical protein [Spirosoma liriopis]
MKQAAVTFLLLVVAFAVSAQNHSRKQTRKPAAKQGICGLVVVKRGNHMPSVDSPSPDSPRSDSDGAPAEREILIFPLLNMSQVDAGDNGFINSVREAKPIKTVRSDKNGKFCINLPVGRYSLIVREPKGLYANLSDTQNNIFPVNVQKNRQLTVKVEITHEAVF